MQNHDISKPIIRPIAKFNEDLSNEEIIETLWNVIQYKNDLILKANTFANDVFQQVMFAEEGKELYLKDRCKRFFNYYRDSSKLTGALLCSIEEFEDTEGDDEE